MEVIGHRGWPARYPDNSLEGILAAREVSSMVEIDVRRTDSGDLVLSHGPVAADDRLVRLDDLLAAVGVFPINFEVKNYPGEAGFEPYHQTGLATAKLARSQDLLTCFYWPTVDEIHRLLPQLRTGLLVDRDWDLALAVHHARKIGHRTIVAQWSLALEEADTTKAAVAEGLELIVWTCNDPALLPELANLGVSGIITDDPGAMTSALKDHT